jgi:hypothetical protein
MDDSDSNTPATKADLIALEERLNQNMGALEERLNQRMEEREERLTETFRDMQTELLKAFYAVAETNQRRLTDAEREAAALKDRMAIMESRLTQVEKRLNMPPAV